MSFLCNNLAAVAVALVASVTVWVFGGLRGDLMPYYMPWLFVFLLEVLLCFPQRHSRESTYDARKRVWAALKRDPLVWVSAGLLLLLLVPLANNGLCPSCDAAKIAEGLDPEPPVPVLPFCVNRLEHLNVMQWFAIALTSMVVVRHCLTGRGKRLVLQLIVWNGVAVAAFGFVQEAMKAPGPLWSDLGLPYWKSGAFFSTFAYPNMAGDYFTSLFGIAVALWRDHLEQLRVAHESKDVSALAEKPSGRFWRRHYYLIPAAIFYFSALNTLSRASIVLSTALAAVCFFHSLVCFLRRQSKVRRVVCGVWSVALFGLVVFFATLFMPKDIQQEVDTLGTVEVLDRVTGKGQYHSRVATAVWKDHLLFGCGGWGYRHLCRSKMTPEELKNIQMVGGVNVHNDHLQFLAEHGLVGFGAMVAIVVLLLWPVVGEWRRILRDLRFKTGKDLPPKPVKLFALPAPAFIILAAALSTVIHAFGDCPMRTPSVLTLFFVELAALPGFMPGGEGKDERELEEIRSHHHHHHHHNH